MKASARLEATDLNAPAKSPGRRTSSACSSTPRERAATSTPFRIAFHAGAIFSGPSFQSTATRLTPGTVSFSSSSILPPKPVGRPLTPVTFPPGRSRLATISLATGSPVDAITMGIVLVALMAAYVASVLWATITSTWSRTISAANSSSRDSSGEDRG